MKKFFRKSKEQQTSTGGQKPCGPARQSSASLPDHDVPERRTTKEHHELALPTNTDPQTLEAQPPVTQYRGFPSPTVHECGAVTSNPPQNPSCKSAALANIHFSGSDKDTTDVESHVPSNSHPEHCVNELTKPRLPQNTPRLRLESQGGSTTEYSEDSHNSRRRSFLVSDVEPSKPIVCDICDKEGPQLCCVACDREGLPYHDACWGKERLHQPGRSRVHRRMLITDLDLLRYINEPNKQADIDDETFEEDNMNCFIEFDVESQKFQFGPRASPMLRMRGRGPQYPSFVSFVGRSMNGKSFLLRALQHGAPVDEFPKPIPAPGAKTHNAASTSSDIHLYADWQTASTGSPILFLDCEGFEGSDTPSSFLRKKMNILAKSVDLSSRREHVEFAHPRLVYAFSTCVVFVTSGPLAESVNIGRKLLSYASHGAMGSQGQGFKPSLLVIFNRFRDGEIESPDFDWSTGSSTKSFLAQDGLSDLLLFYESVHVVYIPSVRTDESDIALQQLNQFQACLREQHIMAFQRRREFDLVFTADKLAQLLQRALTVFSNAHDVVFDWSVEASRAQFELNDLWNQYYKYYTHRAKYPPAQELYNLTSVAFENHIKFCFQLLLVREIRSKSRLEAIPQSLKDLIMKVERILLEHLPCISLSSSGIQCQQTQPRHGDCHQGRKPEGSGVKRWPGVYMAHHTAISQTTQKVLTDTLKLDATPEGLPSIYKTYRFTEASCSVRSVLTCFGCLQVPPSIFLACGHSFCSQCLHDFASDVTDLHRLPNIWCPFHNSRHSFSPRLLPPQAGYRILSLDGGGVKGLSQLIILEHLERACFGIPTAHLYDLIIGTSLGGQIALSLTAPSERTPLSVTQATKQFKEFIEDGFDTIPFPKLRRVVMKGTKYKVSKVERQLKDLFGTKATIHTTPAFPWSSSPNVAVTTVLQDDLRGCLIANYNRPSTQHACPLLKTADPRDDLSVWAAARATSAAPPFFKGFQWQGHTLLDGGFRLGRPDCAAYSEARCIWPTKTCDILISIGTGTNEKPSPRTGVTTKLDISHAVQDDSYRDFPAPSKIFRLDPRYHGSGFELDDFRNSSEIEKQTKAWLSHSTQQAKIADTCAQLVSAVFFFRSTGKTTEGVLTGAILCRLPVALDRRQSLIDAMRDQPNRRLFKIQCNALPPVEIDCSAALEAARCGEELFIPVEIRNLPIGPVELKVEMRNFGRHDQDVAKWYPISGSPYVL